MANGRPRSLDQRFHLALALIAFVVYLQTRQTSVAFTDSGELSAVSCTLGIAHPTGYPLFTLLGWVFSHLPIAGDQIGRLNIMACLCSAAGVFFFSKSLSLLLWSLIEGSVRLEKRIKKRPYLLDAAVAGGAGVLAFSQTYWAQAVAVEVYSLHALMISLVVYCALRAAEDVDLRRWALCGLTLGLAASNHMTSVLLAPGLLVWVLLKEGRQALRPLLAVALGGLAGLLPYAYLPLRARSGPLLNWGNPVSLEALFWHLRGKQYSVWIFSSNDATSRQFGHFVEALPNELGYVGLPLLALGVYWLFKRDRRVLAATAIWFLGCVAFAINYDIHDIDSYFLLAYFIAALWCAVGLFEGLVWLTADKRQGMLLSAVVPAVSLVTHWKAVDESDNHLVEDYTKNMFASFDPNALVISYQWDYWVSAAYYYQLCEGFRPDVMVIDKELLRRSWYFVQLERQFPAVMAKVKPEVEAFLPELRRFEHGEPYDPQVINERFIAITEALIKTNLKERPVYVTHELEPEFTRGFARIPQGLAFRVVEPAMAKPPLGKPAGPLPSFEFRKFDRQGRLEDALLGFYARAYVNHGIYRHVTGNASEARVAAQRALALNPEMPEAKQFLRALDAPPAQRLPPGMRPPMPPGAMPGPPGAMPGPPGARPAP